MQRCLPASVWYQRIIRGGFIFEFPSLQSQLTELVVWGEVERWPRKRNSTALIQGLFPGIIQGIIRTYTGEVLQTSWLGKKRRLTGWRSHSRGWSSNNPDQKLEGHMLTVLKGMTHGVVLPQRTWESVSGGEGKRGHTRASVKGPASFPGSWLRGTVLCQHHGCILLLTLFLSSMSKAPVRRRGPLFLICSFNFPL